MDPTNVLQWIQNLCRICMRDESEIKTAVGAEAANQWKCIFDTIEDETSSIIEFLTKAIPQMEVHVNDLLPKKICDECLPQLLTSYRFQQTCLQSEKEMRQLLAKAQIKVEMTIEQAPTEFVKSEKWKEHNGEVKSAPAVAGPLQVAGADHDGELCKNMEHINGNEFMKIEQDNIDVSATTTQGLSLFDAYVANVEAESKIESIDGELCKNMEHINGNEFMKIEQDDIDVSATTTQELSIFDTYQANVEAESKIESITTQLINECPSNEEREDGKQQQENGSGSSSMYTCTLCPKTFKIHRSLLRHLRRCHKIYKKKTPMTSDQPPRYMCVMCDKTYGSRPSLSKHKKLKHNAAAGGGEVASKSLYTCKYCNKTLARNRVKDHMRTHTGEKPFLCSECGKTFRTSSTLREHLVRHTGVKCYECPECPKKFSCNTDWAAHKVLHRRTKPHICDICGSGFANATYLKRHKRWHSGEKPYKCEFCEKRFFNMSYQRRHMRTHTGEKPYKCKYCTRAFIGSTDLINHLRTHLGDKVYMCELCPSAFRMASELRVHFATHKNDDAETRERNLKALHEQEVKLREKLVQSEPEVSGVLKEEVTELKGDETS